MAPSFRSVSQTTSATFAFTCAKPAGTVAGDVLLAFHTSDLGDIADMLTPTGGTTWLLLASRNIAPDIKTKVWWKVAGSSEPTTYGFTQDSGADGVVAICAVSGAASTTPVVAQSNSTSTSSVTTPSTTPTGSDDFELRWAAGGSGSIAGATWTPPSGFTERADAQSQGLLTTAALATRSLTSSAATGVHTFVCSQTPTRLHGFTVNVAAAPPVTPKDLDDTASAAETLSVAAASALAQAGAAADAASVAAAVGLAQSASAVEALTATVAVALADAGSASQAIVSGQPISVADNGAGADTFAILVTPALAQAGAAADTVRAVATVGLSQAGSASDALAGGPLLLKSIADTAAAADSVSVAIGRDIGSIGAPRQRWPVGAPRARYQVGKPRT